MKRPPAAGLAKLSVTTGEIAKNKSISTVVTDATSSSRDVTFSSASHGDADGSALLLLD